MFLNLASRFRLCMVLRHMKNFFRRLGRIGLTQWILVGLIVGVLIGWLAPEFGKSLNFVSNVFLRMIKSMIAPIIFSTVVVGIAGHGEGSLKNMGKLAVRTLIY